MKIGIVTPSRNQGKYISAPIASVVTLSRPVDYYAIYDSCSTDETSDILNAYKGHAGVSKIVVEEDGGQSDALNRAFNE
ncbi:MAG: glycosyl transferase, partial [Burkholderiales bacterium PBB4]